MFNKKKTVEKPVTSRPVMRGRDTSDRGDSSGPGRDNPLARRFQPEDEPETIDLQDPSRFHATAETEADEPTTRDYDQAPDSTQGERVISFDPRTEKFYIHPGQIPTFLAEDPVRSPTELRRGDRIRIGSAEFHFLSRSKQD